MSGTVETVTGAIEARALGLVDVHEHLFARATPELVAKDPDLDLTDPDPVAHDLEAFAALGGATVIDWTTVDYGRDVVELAALARRTSVNVVAITGFNKGAYNRPYCLGANPEQLARVQIAELEEGVGDTGVRCAAVKFGTSLDRIEPWELVAAEAAALTQAATGCPVFTHTERGTCAEAQLDFLRQRGVPPERVLLAHLDHNPDLEAHLRLAEAGATIGYDQIAKEYYGTTDRAERFLVELARRGLETQVVLGGDFARRSLFAPAGGPGLGWLPRVFRPRLGNSLHEAGLAPEPILRKVMGENAARLLSRDGG